MTASLVGTATDLNNLFETIVSFLTTSSALVAAGQEWEALYYQKDNLLSWSTSMTEQTVDTSAKIEHGCRYDPRKTNMDANTSSDGYVQLSSFISETSYIDMELREAKEVSSIVIGTVSTEVSNSTQGYQLENFELFYSDDGVTWSSAVRVDTADLTGLTGQFFEYNVVSNGAHKYWRLVPINVVSSATSGTMVYTSLVLLTADGTVANHYGGEVIFKAKGNDGTSEIFTGIRTEYNSTNDWYNLILNGYTGFDNHQDGFYNHIGSLPDAHSPLNTMSCPMIPCWNDEMPFWMAASGRSFRMGVKVASSYEGGYLGFLFPYASPTQYPYPLCIGGSLIPTDSNRTTAWRYSYNYYYHSLFTTPSNPSGTSSYRTGTFYARGPDGLWNQYGDRSSSSNPDTITVAYGGDSYPFNPTGNLCSMWPTCCYTTSPTITYLPTREAIGGGYTLTPCIPIQRSPNFYVLGELEGVYIVSGFSNNAENTMVVDGVSHTVLQNGSRTESHEFWAIALPEEPII